jgi:hypothetical protein
MSIDQNAYGYSGCTSPGYPGAANQGGAARQCGGSTYAAASFQQGGQGSGNGSSGGGGAGRFGGGSGGHKWTYTGGGGGGGSSWVHPSVTLVGNAGGSAQQPGGTSSADYVSPTGLGGAPRTDPLGTAALAGSPGRITLRL